MKLYLAGPMNGLPEHNYPAFEKAAAELRAQGHFVFNPAEANPPDGSYRACMAIDLAWICAHAEGIALLPGWQKSRGAMVEAELARCLKLHIMELDRSL